MRRAACGIVAVGAGVLKVWPSSRKAPNERGNAMRFVVPPLCEKPAARPPITMCALCSEDPRFCNEF